jgi:hypothetical protein
MDALFIVVASISLITIWLAVLLRRLLRFREARTRKRLESEIRSIADDLATDPEGLSLTDVIDLLEVEMIQEILAELRRMPSGSRRLQSAIDIAGDENYGRAA